MSEICEIKLKLSLRQIIQFERNQQMIRDRIMKIIEKTRKKAKKSIQRQMRESLLLSLQLQSHAKELEDFINQKNQKPSLDRLLQLLTQINNIFYESDSLGLTDQSLKLMSIAYFKTLNWVQKEMQKIQNEFQGCLEQILHQEKIWSVIEQPLTSIMCALANKPELLSSQQIESHLYLLTFQLTKISTSKTFQQLPFRCLHALSCLLDSNLSHYAYFALMQSNFQRLVLSWMSQDVQLSINFKYVYPILKLTENFLRVKKQIGNFQEFKHVNSKKKHMDQVLAQFVIRQLTMLNERYKNIEDQYNQVDKLYIIDQLNCLLSISIYLQISQNKQQKISLLSLKLVSGESPQLVLTFLIHLGCITHQHKIPFDFMSIEEFDYILSLHRDIPQHDFDEYKNWLVLSLRNMILNEDNQEKAALTIFVQTERHGLMLMEIEQDQSQEMKEFHKVMSQFDFSNA